MSDLISRAATIEAVEILLEQTEEDADVKTWNNAIRGAINSIKHHVPPAQQERKKGCKIVKGTGYYGYCACDQCGKPVHPEDLFCSKCGADFREEDT